MAAPAMNLEAWFLDQYAKGKIIRPSHALRWLKQMPRVVLNDHPFECDEAMIGASGVITAYMTNLLEKGRRPGHILGSMSLHETDSFMITTRGIPINTTAQTRESFSAHYVVMRPGNQPTQWYALGPASDIMLTCKLTGCTFAARNNAGVVEVTHVQPAGGLSGEDVNRNMQYTPPNEPKPVAFGRLSYSLETRTGTIIGVRGPKGWEIYAQLLARNVTPLRICGVKRIYPPE